MHMVGHRCMERHHPSGARVERWGKSPPGAIVRWCAARLMGCKVKYTGKEAAPRCMLRMGGSPIAGG